jgi:hypothetical protein
LVLPLSIREADGDFAHIWFSNGKRLPAAHLCAAIQRAMRSDKAPIRDIGHIPKPRDEIIVHEWGSSPDGLVSGTKGRIQMRKIGFFAAGAALILFGLVMWTTTTTHALVATTGNSPLAMMAVAGDLPTSHFDDYSLIFNW